MLGGFTSTLCAIHMSILFTEESFSNGIDRCAIP